MRLFHDLVGWVLLIFLAAFEAVGSVDSFRALPLLQVLDLLSREGT